MRFFAKAAPAFLFVSVLSATPALAQPRDAFAAACMNRQNATPSNCACQSKLARANLDRREQQAALSALRGDKENFGKQVRALGQAKAKVFSGKMQTLSVQSKALCR